HPILSVVISQADLRSTLGDAGYIVFGVILFVWELLPTSLVVYFFRVRRPNQDKSGTGLPGHVFSSRAYFFDNPRRYDSDDDLVWSIIPQNVQARYVNNTQTINQSIKLYLSHAPNTTGVE
uniref:Uncharacterized protein n=1 Tax=Hucho hucho TaxID=62062 RepID=A0A4W5JNX5_9TELE